MTDLPESRARNVADNAYLLLGSRLAMAATPFVASLLVYLGGMYLDARFAQTRQTIAELDKRVATVQAQSDDNGKEIALLRTAQAVTSTSVQSAATFNNNWQSNVNARLDKLTDAVAGLDRSIAALNATVGRLGPVARPPP